MQVYMDNAATSRQKPDCVIQEMERFFRENNCNPGRGGYELSLEAGREVLRAREVVAAFFNVPKSDQVIFTPNVTHALNVALKGLLKPHDHVLISGWEHNAVVRPLTALAQTRGITFTILPTGEEGNFEPASVLEAVKPQTKIIVMTHASNVTGRILPVEEVAIIAQKLGLYFVVDCAQTAGCLPLDFQSLGASVLAFTGHKHLLGPMGIGGFCVEREVARKMRPLVEGGTGSTSHQEYQPEFLPDKFESGTQNTLGIVGLRAALEYLASIGVAKVREKERELTGRLLEGLLRLPGVQVYGPKDPFKQTGTVSINIAGVDNAELSHVLDQQYGIMARPGLHCSPVAHRTIGTFPEGTLRLSLGHYTTKEDIEYVLHSLSKIN